MALVFNYLSTSEVDCTVMTLDQVIILNFMSLSIPGKWNF